MGQPMIGEFEHTMDDKGRVSLPASFRKELPETVILAPGLNGQVNVFSKEGFTAWKESLWGDSGYNVTNVQQNKARQYYNSNACSVDVDSAGRINVPQRLRDHAGLLPKQAVLVNGDEDHVCLWNPDRWSDYIGDFDPNDLLVG